MQPGTNVSSNEPGGKSKRNGWLLLIGAVLFVAACEIVFHWLLGRGVFPTVLALYLWVDPLTRKGTLVQSVINSAPAAVLGFANGWIGYPRWSARTVGVTALIIALFVDTLTHLLIGHRQFAIVGRSWIFALVDTGFWTLGAYVFRRDWKRRRG